MLLKMFSIYDSKITVFFTPFFAPHEQVAKRSLMSSVNDPASMIAASPADFTLFELGAWDDETGKFELLDKPVNHGLAANYRTRNHAQDAQESQRDETQLQRGAKG